MNGPVVEANNSDKNNNESPLTLILSRKSKGRDYNIGIYDQLGLILSFLPSATVNLPPGIILTGPVMMHSFPLIGLMITSIPSMIGEGGIT